MSRRFYRDPCVAHIAEWIAQQGMQLKPDRSQAALFLRELDKSSTQFSFRTFSDSAYTRIGAFDPLEKALHGSLAECWEELTQLNQHGAVVTVTINRTNGRGRSEADVEQVRALFIDDDLGGGSERFKIPPI